MRICPTVQGSPSPLIIHRIGCDVCQTRQRTFFHKCHRCIYRGKPANWEPDDAELLIEVDVAAAEKNGAAKPAQKKAPAKPKRGKSPDGKPDSVVGRGLTSGAT